MIQQETTEGIRNTDARTIPVLLVLAFFLSWFPRLFWGFWTDEAGTFWMAAEGWWASIERTTQWPGQSLLYSLLESFFAWKGAGQEFALRIPSVLAMVWAGWEMKRLAEITLGKAYGWLAILPLACAPEAIEFGTSARPYALAMAASLASFRHLLVWQELEPGANRWKPIAKYLGAAVLTLYLHYLFAFVIGIQALYLLFCRFVRGRQVALDLPVVAAVVLPLSLVPLIGSLLVTARTVVAFASAAKPEFTDLLRLCFPPALALGVGLGAMVLIASARKLRWRATPVRPELVFLVLTWMLVGPVVFFIAARVTEHSVFNSRYLLFTLPALSLLIVWAVSGLEQASWRKTMAVAIFGASILHPGMLLYSFREGPMSWKPALQQIVRESSNENPAPVFVESGLAHSGGLNWQEHDPATSPLYAALLAYPMANRAIPLPYQFSAAAQEFVRERLEKDLRSQPRLWLVAGADSPQATWMIEHLKGLGYRAETGNFNHFVVVDFRRDGGARSSLP
jgi:hypothetical protein